MSSRTRVLFSTLMLPFVALLVAPSAWAQQQPPPEAQEMMAELQQIQQRLQDLQERALEDSTLQQQRTATTAAVRNAMIDADAEIGPSLDRMEAMMEELRAAQEAGDMPKIIALNEEAQEIQPRIAQAQATALAREDVQEAIATFQANLRSRMVELDPDTDSLMERARQLEERLRGSG